MRTVNKDGQSDLSPEVTYTMQAGRAAQKVEVQVLATNKFKVSWDSPADVSQTITAYIVSYKLMAQSDCQLAPGQLIEKEVAGTEKSAEISGLAPASTCEVTVRARTSVELLPSDPISVTTKESTPNGPPLNVKIS